MRAGKVDLLVILGGNPAYDAPADLEFADALKNGKVPLRVHLGLYQNETAELCQWHVNQAHYLESWSDARAYDGTVSIIQPLIAPLYSGKSAHEFVALLSGQADAAGHDLVQAYWQKQHTGADFDAFWRKSLHDGWIEGTAFAPQIGRAEDAQRPGTHRLPVRSCPNTIEINFRRDPSIYDGQFSNNGWLQELPKPMTKLTWDNAMLIGPKMAERLKLKSKMSSSSNSTARRSKAQSGFRPGIPTTRSPSFSATAARAPAASAPRRASTPIRCAPVPLHGSPPALQIRKTGETYKLATTQGYQTMETPDGGHRPLVRETTLEEYRKEPEVREGRRARARTHSLQALSDYKEEAYSWGMAIDLNSCVGCNNCIVACQSENNIAVVGKEQVVIGRHMHWIRVDTYYQGDRDNPKAFFQPVPCMQCENAPCEVVCPVGATMHRSEGLNDMVYNRCVGTRYCSNNCPYKVRRFNFLLFQDWETPQYKMMRNPDVTVRSRGVMEKCTYCVQRINEHRIDAETASVREGKRHQDRTTNCRPPASSRVRRTRSCSATSTIRTARFRS